MVSKHYVVGGWDIHICPKAKRAQRSGFGAPWLLGHEAFVIFEMGFKLTRNHRDINDVLSTVG